MATTLAEFLAESQRAGARYQLPGYFEKADYLESGDIFTQTAGKKVWDALNNQTKLWNMLRKVGWGPVAGFRLRVGRGTGSSGPILEAGELPEIQKSAIENVLLDPKQIGTSLGVTLKAQLTSSLEGGIGDALAIEQEAKSRDHIKEINQEMLLSATTIVKTSAGTGEDSGELAQPQYFRKGDRIKGTTQTTAGTIKKINYTTGEIYLIDANGDKLELTDGEVVYVIGRAGLTSLDEIIDHDGRTVAGVAITGEGPECYNLTDRNPTTKPWACGIVLDNNGTSRDLSLGLIDEAMRRVRARGGNPDLIVTGWDQYERLAHLVSPLQRFIDYGDFVVKVGDEETLPGTRAGFELAQYRGCAVLGDDDVPHGVDANNNDIGSVIYVLDTRFLEVAVLTPTQYLENRDYIAAGSTVVRGLFLTCCESRCLNPYVQCAIRDLKD